MCKLPHLLCRYTIGIDTTVATTGVPVITIKAAAVADTMGSASDAIVIAIGTALIAIRYAVLDIVILKKKSLPVLA